jgi:hypothetical protein
MRLPPVVAAHLNAYCAATGRRRTDVILQAIMNIPLPKGASPLRPSSASRSTPAGRSMHYKMRAPTMVIMSFDIGESKPRTMVFSRPSKQADTWTWSVLWRRGVTVRGWDIETREIPPLLNLSDDDIWAAIESGEAVEFDEDNKEHRLLAQLRHGVHTRPRAEVEAEEQEQKERFERQLRNLPVANLADVYPDAVESDADDSAPGEVGALETLGD